MRRFSPVFIASAVLTAAALALWGLVADCTAGGDNSGMVQLGRAAAITVSGIATLCWYAWGHGRRDRDRSALIRTLARTVPLRRVP